MFKRSRKFFLWLAFFVFGKSLAQLSGTYNVPATYTSIAAAINALNTQGVSGPVTIEINAGYTETAPVGGFSLTATGTALNPITFIKTGIGANPLVSAYAGGTATPLSARQDGIWSLIGCDYITINGIDLQDLNGSNPSTMEYGFGFFKSSASDGCQNNQILNCVVSLNFVNNAAGSGTSADGSRCINMVNALFTSQTTALIPSGLSGTNSNNVFYSNTLQNCNIGIALIGYAAPSPYTLADQANEIGGNGLATGNSILNFGGAASAVNPAAGIRTLAQYNLRVAYNVLNNNNGSGANHSTTLRGVFTNAAAGANTSILNNTLTIRSSAVTAPVAVIENLAGATPNNNTVSINSNVITNCSATLNTTGTFYAIFNNAASPTVFQANGNQITNLQTTATSGNVYLIYNTGAASASLQMNNNVVTNFTTQATTSGACYGLFNNVPTGAYLDISANSFSNCQTAASTGPTHLIYNSSAVSNSISMSSNSISACANILNSSGAFFGIFNGGSSTGLSISQNRFANHTLNATSSAAQMIYNTGACSGPAQFNNNTFSVCSSAYTGAGSYYSIYNNAASAASLEINNNVFSQYATAATTGSTHLIFNRGSSTNTYVTASFNNNLVTNCTFSASGNGPVLGIYNLGVTAGDLSLSNNTVTANNWMTTTSTRYLVCNTGPVTTTLLLNNNTITNNTNTVNTTGVFNALLNLGTVGTALQINSNTINNNYNTATTGGAYYIFNSGQVAAGAITVTNNLITSNTNSATGSADFYAVYNQGTTFGSLDVTSNNISQNNLFGGTGATNFLYNTAAVTTSINSVAITSNAMVNNSVTVTSSGSFFGIYNNSASAANLSISNNTFTGGVVTASTGANHYIYNRGTVTNTFANIQMVNNLLHSNSNNSAGSAAFYSIWNNGVTSAITTIANNTVTATTWNTLSGLRYHIANWGVATTSASVSGNLLTGNTHSGSTTGSLFYIYCNNNTAASSGTLSILSNTITGNSSSASSGETHLINTSGVSSNTYAAIYIQNNLQTTYTSNVSGAGAFYGIYNNASSTTEMVFANNTFSNNVINSANAANYFIHNRGAANTVLGSVLISANLFSSNTCSMATGGSWFGLLNSGAGSTSSNSLNINANNISNSEFNFTNATVNLINNTCPVSGRMDIQNNTISNINNTLTTTGNFFGINNGGLSAGGVLAVSANSLSGLYSTATNGSKFLIYNSGNVTNSISITGNVITATSHTASGTGSYYSIYNNSNSSATNVAMGGNTLSNNSCYLASGTSILFYNGGVISNTLAQVDISNNSVQNFTSSSTNGPFYGIFNSGYTCNDLSIVSNTLNSLSYLSAAGSKQPIFNNGRVLGVLSISGNLLSNQSATSNVGGTFMGIGNSVSFANGNFPSNLNISNNTVQNVDLTSGTGPITMISNSGVTTNTITNAAIQSNLFSGINLSITAGGSFIGVNNTSIASSTLGIQNNSLVTVNCTSTNSPRTGFLNGGPAAVVNFSNNLISGFTSTVNTTGSCFGISNSGNVTTELNITANTVMAHTVTATTGTFYAAYNTGGVSGTITISNNRISDIVSSASTSGGFLGLFNNAGSSSALVMSANTFTNMTLSSLTGWTSFLYNRAAVVNTISNMMIQNNVVGTVSITTNSGQFFGFFNNGSSFSDLSVSSNSFLTIVTSATSNPRYLFYNSGSGFSSLSFNNNFVFGFSSPLNTSGAFYGIFNPSNCAGNLTVSANSFSSIDLGSTTGAAFLINNSGTISGTTSIVSNSFSTLSFSATTGAFYGISNSGSSPSAINISGNSLNGAIITATGNVRYGFYNSANSLNTTNLDNNLLSNFTSTLSTTTAFFGIHNIGHSAGNISLSGNTLSTLNLASTTGTNYLVYNTGTLNGVADLNGNTLSNCTSTSTGAGTFYGIYNLASGTGTNNLNNNLINNLNLGVQGAATYLFYNNATNTNVAVSAVSMANNTVSTLVKSGTSSPFYGLFNNLVASSNLNLSNNTFTNSTISGTSGAMYLLLNTGSVASQANMDGNQVGGLSSTLNSTGDFYGIYNTAACQGNLSMTANKFENNLVDGVSNTVMLVRNNASVNGSLSINSNTVNACSNTSLTSGDFYGLWNSGLVQGELSLSANTFSANASSVTTGNIFLLYNSGTANGSITVNANRLGQVLTNTTNDFSGNLIAIGNATGTTSSSLAVSSNSFSGFSYNGLSGSGTIYFIRNTNDNAVLNVSGNTWNNLSLKHAGSEYLIYNPSSTQNSLTVNNNSITGTYHRTGVAGSIYMYYGSGSSPVGSQQVISGNDFSNVTATVQGSGSFYGIYTNDGITSPYPRKTITNNRISNVNYNGLGFFYGIYADLLGDGGTTQGSSINTNTLQAVSFAGPLIGYGIGTACSPNYTTHLFSNLAQSLTCTSQNSEIQAFQLAGTGIALSVYQNKVSEIAATGTEGSASGIYVQNANTTTLFNNLVGNISAPATSYSNGVNGISIMGGTRVNLYYNTVYLNAASTGSLFNSSALYASGSVSLNLQNNILINLSTPAGTGLTCAYRRNTASLSNYASTSNRNVFYAGIPAANRLIYHDGTAYQTLAAFQTLVNPRESASIFENTNFSSTSGVSPAFLHINTSLPSLTESAAQNLGVTNDYDNDIRQGNPGYTSSGTAPDIGADEYDPNLVPCSGVSSGTAIVPSTGIQCSGSEVFMMVNGQTQAGGISYQWKVAASSGGPFSNVTGGSGATTAAYNTATLNSGTYYFMMVSTCAVNSQTAATNVLTVNVNQNPTVTVSVANPTVCAGETLSFTANSSTAINFLWTGPNNFSSTLQNPVVSSVVANSTGTYSLVVSDANCTATPVFVAAQVNATPPAFVLTPSATPLCIGNSQTISASIPITSPTLTIGSQSGQNSASGYPAPYSLYYGGQKMQVLILANELSAVGFTIGSPITSIQFPVVSKGANWGTLVNDCQNFMVGIKTTTVPSLTGFENGIVNVVSPANFTPSLGYANTHVFSAPFIWDGVSNLIIETVFSNSLVGTSGNAVIQNNHPTGFLSTLVYRADNQNVSTIAAATSSNVNVGFVRPDLKLNGIAVGSYSWGPSAGLSAQTGASVSASPLLNTVYTATLSNGNCSTTASSSIQVIQIPTLSIATSANTVCVGNNATLTVNGAATYTWFNSSNNSSLVVSPFGNTTYSVVGSNPACPQATASIQLISAPALVLTGQANPAQICWGKSSTLSVSGAPTYSWSDGTNNDSLVVTPTVNSSYTVYATNGPGCWASKIMSVQVNPLPVITISPTSATVCPGDFLTLEASGVLSFTWQPGNSNSPILMINPNQSTIYEVTGVDLYGCKNTASATVIVDPCQGVPDYENQEAKVFPNPTSAEVQLHFGSSMKREIVVLNTMGQVVLVKEVQNNNDRLDVGHLAAGMYTLLVKETNRTLQYKLVKN